MQCPHCGPVPEICTQCGEIIEPPNVHRLVLEVADGSPLHEALKEYGCWHHLTPEQVVRHIVRWMLVPDQVMLEEQK